MKISTVSAVLSVASFMAILFSPSNTNYWILFLILGIVLGIIWLIMREK